MILLIKIIMSRYIITWRYINYEDSLNPNIVKSDNEELNYAFNIKEHVFSIIIYQSIFVFN